MKPSWNSAPEWANFLTQDEDCEWYWHEDEPRIRCNYDGKGYWLSNGHMDSAGGWENSLEGRP